MFPRSIRLVVLTGILCASFSHWSALVAQQAAPKSTSQQKPAKPAASADDAVTKAQILESPQWRRVMFEFKEWLSAQQIYDAKQVEELKGRFNRRVAAMSTTELEYLLADMQAKFQILDTPQAQEARSWMASYLSVMSDTKRAEVLKDIPNVATMTAAQLQQEIMKIEQKRKTIDSEQSAFQRTQQELTTRQLAQDQQAQQTYIRERDRFPSSTTYSPYRSPSDVNSHLNQGRVGSGTSYYVGPFGGVGMSFSGASF